MARAITYYYPDETNPSAMKVFQDKSSQIRAFSFKKGYLKRISEEAFANNYAVYFLFGSESEETKTIYIGQSKQGASRIYSHVLTKEFWNHCIMFVSDNNVFDANVIDYIEYYFIDLLKRKSSYSLDNIVQSVTEPNLSIFDKITINAYIEQIEFLLKAEGKDLVEREKDSDIKYYSPKSKNYDAKVYFQDGKFIVEIGSTIFKPKESMHGWSDGGKFYSKLYSHLKNLLEEKKLAELNDNYKTLVRIPFASVSGAAEFISGASVNGWDFFDGISELKEEQN